MSSRYELARLWSEAQALRAEGKEVKGLTDAVEQEMFLQAERRADNFWAERRKAKEITVSGTVSDTVLYEAKGVKV